MGQAQNIFQARAPSTRKATHKQLACVAHTVLTGPHLTHRRAQAPAMTFERTTASRTRTDLKSGAAALKGASQI